MKRILLGCLTVILTGCSTLGPRAIRSEQYPYNEAIVYNNREQLLLNIVRLRYMDQPYFLEVSSVTSSYTLGASGGVSAKLSPDSTLGNTITPSLSANYSSEPTISYAPVTGEQFVKQLLSPMPPEFILSLTQSGWDIGRVFNICIQRINDMGNAVSGDGPVPTDPPSYQEFFKLTQNLSILEREGLVELGEEPGAGKNASFAMSIKGSNNSQLDALAKETKQMLGVDENSPYFAFTGEFLDSVDNEVRIRPRSLLGAMFYVSQAVDVPQSHINAGIVKMTQNPDGSLFDWNEVSGQVLNIRSCAKAPAYAHTAVKYRGYWFYIDDRDANSKASFFLISKLANLQGGQVKNIAPTLTIPVKG